MPDIRLSFPAFRRRLPSTVTLRSDAMAILAYASGNVIWTGSAMKERHTNQTVVRQPRKADLPGLAVGSIETIPRQEVVVAPSPVSGGEACAVLVGCAIAFSSFYEYVGASDPAARLTILTDPDLFNTITRSFREASLSSFDADFLNLHPYWLAATVTVLEHVTLSEALPRPAAIGGFPLSTVLVGAIHLASMATPFDRVVPALEHIAREVTEDEC